MEQCELAGLVAEGSHRVVELVDDIAEFLIRRERHVPWTRAGRKGERRQRSTDLRGGGVEGVHQSLIKSQIRHEQPRIRLVEINSMRVRAFLASLIRSRALVGN